MTVNSVRSFNTAKEVDEAVQREGRLAYIEMPAPAYHATQAVSQSTLKKVASSPAKLKWDLDNPRRDTPQAFLLGSAIHMALLEPDKFEASYIAMPKVDRRTKEGKAKAEEFEKIANGRIVLQQDEMDTVCRVHARATDDDNLGKYFRGGVHESSFFARDEQTGLVLRCRPDQLVETAEGLFVVDLKTSDCAAPKVFKHDIEKYGYLIQAAFYMDTIEAATGKRPDGFIIVAVEKSRDCDYTTWLIPDEVLLNETKEYRKLLNVFAECVKSSKWPGYGSEINTYEYPKWKQNSFEEAW